MNVVVLCDVFCMSILCPRCCVVVDVCLMCSHFCFGVVMCVFCLCVVCCVVVDVRVYSSVLFRCFSCVCVACV